MTLERAAMEAGVSVREMMEHLKRGRVPAQYDIEDLDMGPSREDGEVKLGARFSSITPTSRPRLLFLFL